MSLNWVVSAQKTEILSRIASRVLGHAREQRLTIYLEAIYVMRDLGLVINHSGHILDLDRLLKFSDLDFEHDIRGIHNNLNRNTGKLENCFLPRCASK